MLNIETKCQAALVGLASGALGGLLLFLT